MKQKISLTIEENVYKKFMQYCKERGMKVSSKVELLMIDKMKKHKEVQ